MGSPNIPEFANRKMLEFKKKPAEERLKNPGDDEPPSLDDLIPDKTPKK